MKSFKSLLLLLVLTVVAIPAFASEPASNTVPDPNSASSQLTSEIAKMDDAQKSKLLDTIHSGPTATAKKAQEWIDIGNGIGSGLAATAGKLGVEVNKFAATPVGKMAMVLIIWNYMGDDISGIVEGLLFWLLFLPMWLYAARKTMGVYDDKGKFLRFDRELFFDNTKYGSIPAVFLISLVLIVAIGIIFIA